MRDGEWANPTSNHVWSDEEINERLATQPRHQPETWSDVAAINFLRAAYWTFNTGMARLYVCVCVCACVCVYVFSATFSSPLCRAPPPRPPSEMSELAHSSSLNQELARSNVHRPIACSTNYYTRSLSHATHNHTSLSIHTSTHPQITTPPISHWVQGREPVRRKRGVSDDLPRECSRGAGDGCRPAPPLPVATLH
jgi:hypothetical protein